MTNASNTRLGDNEYKHCQNADCNSPLFSGSTVWAESDWLGEAIYCDKGCCDAAE